MVSCGDLVLRLYMAETGIGTREFKIKRFLRDET
jgi:hypothetical protein